MIKLDFGPFLSAMKMKFLGEVAKMKAREFFSLWEDYLRDPTWHPCRIITDEGRSCKEIINGEYERLKRLKSEIGEDAYNAVIREKNEINKYNIRDGLIVQKV